MFKVALLVVGGLLVARKLAGGTSTPVPSRDGIRSEVADGDRYRVEEADR